MITTIIIIAIAAVIFFWVIGVQRKLVEKEEFCKNSMSQIGVQQNSRWDAITALVDLIKSYNEHEYRTIKDVIAQRREINGNSSASEADAQDAAFTKVFGQIKAVAENYPDIKAIDTYNKTMDSVNMYENQVRMSRMVYNDTVTNYNKIVRQFPESLIASLLKFALKDYLKDPEGKTDMPSTKI